MRASEKVTLSLPKELMDAVRELAPSRGYSKFIAEAVEFFIASKRRQDLRQRLIAGYQSNATADAALAAEWDPLEEESWSKYVRPYEGEKPTDGA